MDKKDAKRDSKLFNIYNGRFVKNWMPNTIQLVRLDTHPQYSDWRGITRKYLTNLIVIGTNHIKLYVIFEDGTSQELCQTPIMDNIRSVNQLQRTLLIETNKKMFGLVYQNGFFSTVCMLSLEFLGLPSDYQSFVRIDSFYRYCLFVANQHIVMMMPKKYDLKQYGNIQFEKVTEDVVWKSSKNYDFFHSVYTYRVKDKVKDIYDIVLDSGSVYFLVREGQEFAVYCLNIESIVQPGGELLRKVYGMLPPAKHLIALTPNKQSHLLLLTQNKAIFLPTPASQLQSTEIPLQLTEIVSVRLFYTGAVFFCTSHRVYCLQLISGELKVHPICESKERLQNFCLLKYIPPNPDSLKVILLTSCKVILKNQMQNTIIFRSLNSLLDFYVSNIDKNVIAIEKDDLEEGNNNLNKLIVIKRVFKPIDKVYMSSKKSFFEKLAGQLESVQGLPLHGWLAVRSEKLWSIYKDVMEETAAILKVQGIEAFEEIYQSEAGSGAKYFIGRKDDKVLVYQNSRQKFNSQLSKSGKLFLIEHLLVSVESSDNSIQLLNLESQQKAKISFMASEDCIKMAVIKKNYSFRKLNSKFRLLLLCCFERQLQVYQIDNNDIVLHFRCNFLNEGLPYLRNHLFDQKQGRSIDKTYFRSLSDPDYLLPFQQTLSTDKISDMLVSQLSSMTILILQTFSNDYFVYQMVPHFNDVGIIFRRIILPLSRSSADTTLTQYSKDLVRFGNRLFIDNVVMETTEQFSHCFRNSNFDVWILNQDHKLRPVDVKGDRISGKIVSTIAEGKSFVGVENSLDYYVAYTKDTVEMYDKEFNKKGVFQVQEGSTNCQIITAKMSQSFLGVSTYQHYREKAGFESIKFQFTLFDVKAKTVRYDSMPMDQAVIAIRFTRSGKIMLISSTLIHIYEIRNKLEHHRTITYCQRALVSSVGFFYKSTRGEPHFLLAAGVFGGLSFFLYDDDKMILEERWFEPLKCGMREVQIFRYGKWFKGMIADHDKNLIVVDLKDSSMDKIADFNVGSRVNKMVRVDESICACFVDGSIQMFTPVELKDEDISLLRFQSIISEQLPFAGGLNERQYRKLKQYCKSYKFISKGNFVEYGMMELFMSLSRPLQRALLYKSSFTEEEIRAIATKYCVY